MRHTQDTGLLNSQLTTNSPSKSLSVAHRGYFDENRMLVCRIKKIWMAGNITTDYTFLQKLYYCITNFHYALLQKCIFA